MVAVQRGVRAAADEAIDSHSYALPRHSGPKIHDMHLYPCRSTIRPLNGSHDKVNGASRKLLCIWASESHRLHQGAIEGERQSSMPAIPHQAHTGKRDIAEEEGGFSVPHPRRRELIRQRSKVYRAATSEGGCKVNRELGCTRLSLRRACGTESR
jgi:hypothetical protein